MSAIESFVSFINHWIWWFLPVPLLLAGAYFGFSTLFVQIRMIPDMFRAVKEPSASGKDSKETISAFQAFTISAAARVGTGNVVGVSLAIAIGGPGAVFWMWVVALVGGATAFVESTLAQLWKSRDGETFVGGPAFYMTRGLNAKPLALIFGIAITVTYGFVYNAVQTNSISNALANSLGTDSMGIKVAVGAIVSAVTALIIFGGVNRIARATQLIVPFMAGAYILIGVLVLVLNFREIPEMFALIVGHAVGLKEISGATLGLAFAQGMRRGLFSNEAGQGSAPNAAATASVSHPVKQGLVQTLGVYFDSLVVCSITAFIILLSNPVFGDTADTTLTQQALASQVGSWGTHFVTFILFFLAFSSVLGNYYLAQANVEYFSRSPKVMAAFRAIVVLCVFGGAIGTVPLVWALADTFAATMVIINLIAIIPLGNVAFRLLRHFNEQKRQGLDPVFHRDDIPGLKNVECWDGTDPGTQVAAK